MPGAEYAIEVVGGKHDGVRGMYWTDDGEHPPPNFIVVGTCSGSGECGQGSAAACRKYAAILRRENGGDGPSQVRHPAYWTPDEDLPVDGEKYRLTHVRSEGDGAPDVAVYVVAGVTRRDPSSEVHEERPLTVADILAAKPAVPAPATALAKAIARARDMGLDVSSGARSPDGLPIHPMCRGSYHYTGWAEDPLPELSDDEVRAIWAVAKKMLGWGRMSKLERLISLPPGRHDQGWTA